jgi:NAD(P)-dependent dehydrogenase (short-subunit alcohol dehydrogenase family)
MTIPTSKPVGGLQGRVALVTGASSGIGRATARLLAESGARVLATGRNRTALEALAAESAAHGVSIVTRSGDVTSEDFRSALVGDTVETLGGIDVLVNAAGIIAMGDWEKTSLEDWDRMLDVNLRAVFALTKLAIPHLTTSRGAIVNVSSVTYCVSKAAVDQLTRCLALELAPRGIRVNAVNPGVVRTNLHRASGMEEERYGVFLEHSKTTHPLGRVGEPAEVAALIAFLASDAAGWITGETIAIDGGRHQTCAR